jgi:hypothetical protein
VRRRRSGRDRHAALQPRCLRVSRHVVGLR